MAEVLSRTKYVRASELVDLKSHEGQTFITRRNNAVLAVKLVKVKGTKVYLEYTEKRVDSFSIPLQKFLNYYELPSKG